MGAGLRKSGVAKQPTPKSSGEVTLRPGVFLDRDGTVIRHVPYLSDPAKIRLLPGAAGAIRELNQAGIPVILVSNQSGVARGLMQEADVRAVNREMEARLKRRGAYLDRIEYCPHYAQGKIPRYAVACGCRKPAPGMLRKAAKALGIDLSRSLIIGDNLSDLEAGWRAGTATLLLLSGHGKATRKALQNTGRRPDKIISSLAQAVAWWLGREARSK
jgi:D-glycero-D-manno-heptose 1,7-bisphosphate phosphatase